MNDHRQLNTPSPVVFPSASPTPKLYSTPSKKLPNVKSWQEIGVDSVPHIMYPQYDHSREKLMPSPLSIDIEEDFLASIISSGSFHEPPIVGSPCTPTVMDDPVVERRHASHASKFGSFLSRVKKVTSGKSLKNRTR